MVDQTLEEIRQISGLLSAHGDRAERVTNCLCALPEHVAPLIVYLASDLSKEVTKRIFFVGGGRIAEMRMLRTEGVTKETPWTPTEIAAKIETILD